MGLLDRVRSARAYGFDQLGGLEKVPGFPMLPAHQASLPYGLQTWAKSSSVEVEQSLPGYWQAIQLSPPAFAAQMVRAAALSQARFVFRDTVDRHMYGSYETDNRRNTALRILETPWPNGTTADLINRMEWHAGLAGNAYVYHQGDRLRVLRPDWVAVLYGSQQDPDQAAHALDGTLLGYAYWPGGPHSGNRPYLLDVAEVAHWAPIPDPSGGTIGTSWLTPAIRDIQGDYAATSHKLKFFVNAATPNMVIKGLPSTDEQQFNDLVDMLEKSHAGVGNAYRTLYLTEGADASVVGSNLQQLDFKATQGAGETRIAVLSRVPAVLLGISEGLQGSSLNAGNYGMARRSFADTFISEHLQSLCGSLASIVPVPSGSELWFDTADMPLLREDAKDAAEINQINAFTISQLVREGFTAESAAEFAVTGDPADLVHTGLVSVQMQTPGTWHGVTDAPPGSQTQAEVEAAGSTSNPNPVKSTPPGQGAPPGGNGP